ncbi:unnamed protein product, partial [Mesorhabditis belari]|uniref:Uncharacterized protein n=1 Tax=Mesorhabditis belari TaxID=2138241 RepID=A0AAF3EQI4_9BILA
MLVKTLCFILFVAVSEARFLNNGGRNTFFSTSQSSTSMGMMNGECRVEDGIIYDGDSKRQITAIEQAELSAYFQQLQQWQYSSTMSFMEKMKKSMRSMFDFQHHMYSKIFSGEIDFPFGSTPFFQMEPIPMMEMGSMPTPPCLCRSVPCSSRVAEEFEGTAQPSQQPAQGPVPQQTQPLQQAQPQPQPQQLQARPRSKRSTIYHQTTSSASGNYPGRHRTTKTPKIRVLSRSKTTRFGPIYRSGSFSHSSQTTRYFKPFNKGKKPTTVYLSQPVAQYPSTNTGLYTQPRTVIYSDPYTGGLHQHSTATGPGYSSVSHTYSYGNGAPDTRSMMEMAGTQGILASMQQEMDDLML